MKNPTKGLPRGTLDIYKKSLETKRKLSKCFLKSIQDPSCYSNTKSGPCAHITYCPASFPWTCDTSQHTTVTAETAKCWDSQSCLVSSTR